MRKANAICPCADSVGKRRNMYCGVGMGIGIVRATDGSVLISRWEVMPCDPNGRVHRSNAGSFLPCRIIFLLYLTTQSPFVNVTLHPASARTLIPKSEAIERSGMMCPINVTGSPSIFILHICVDMTWHPSASATLSGILVGRLFITGVPSITNICVAPESAMACFVGRQNVPPAISACISWVLERAWYAVTVGRLLVMFVVGTVMSSSLTSDALAVKQ
jgi:hypothetical protein